LLTACLATHAAAQERAPIASALTSAVANAADEISSPGGEPQAAAPATSAENPVLTFFKNTELSGFVDTYYSYNFNTPAKACATVGGVAIVNCLHNFDVSHNAFSLNLAEIALEKKPAADSRGGFRIDLDYGSAAAIVAGFDPSPTSINQNIQQAYVSYLAPAGTGTLQVDVGKFVTQHGAEVIETKDNWNYSRSLLFSLAIPYYHMGVRAAYSPNDKVTLGANISNGWNNVVENNTGKTAGFMAIVKPTSAVSWTVNYMVGPEQTDNNSDLRHLFDTTIAYTASPKVSLMLNYDFGKDTVSKAGVTWQGVGGYLKYAPNSWFTLVPRYEYLQDRDGFMTGVSQNVQEFTLTAEFKHKDGVMIRVEYRGDMAETPYFVKNVSETSKNQHALTMAWVYVFSSKTP
jgi:hypothetical protein